MVLVHAAVAVATPWGPLYLLLPSLAMLVLASAVFPVTKIVTIQQPGFRTMAFPSCSVVIHFYIFYTKLTLVS